MAAVNASSGQNMTTARSDQNIEVMVQSFRQFADIAVKLHHFYFDQHTDAEIKAAFSWDDAKLAATKDVVNSGYLIQQIAYGQAAGQSSAVGAGNNFMTSPDAAVPL